MLKNMVIRLSRLNSNGTFVNTKVPPSLRNKMNIKIRLENKDDFREVENLTREAFWDVYKPGCDEHLVLHNLRNSSSFIKELDFVAVIDGKIVGNIVYSKASVTDDKNICHEVLVMGPLCVAPSLQKKGIGTKLIDHSLTKAKEMGFKGVILFGNPAYYSRFGFENAKKYNIQTSDGKNFDPFMALELSKNSLQGVCGRLHADPVFEVDKNELEDFDKQFPPKEKHVTDTQSKI